MDIKSEDTDDANEPKFNRLLKSAWNNASNLGYFRYQLDDLKTKILDGQYGFVAQLNVKRAQERRPPQEVDSIDMLFSAEKFNFNKIKDGEILMYINCKERPIKEESEKIGLAGFMEVLHPRPMTLVAILIWEFRISMNPAKAVFRRHAIIINASPLEYCNSLLVPSVRKCQNQVLREDGLRLAIHIMFLSSNRHFRIGFNALTAYASVNHFHLHMYYLNYKLYIETAELRMLSGETSNCFEFLDYPAQGFVFLTKIEDIEDVVKSVMRFVKYFLKNGIAHTLFMTWGQGQNVCDDKEPYDTVRVILWARNSVKGVKMADAVIPALCELAGHILIKVEDTYVNATEEQIVSLLHNACHEQFIKVKSDIRSII